MKKKLLSLLMAGAVVAGSTVPAFAATTQTIDGLDSATLNADVKVTGSVSDSKGTAPAGRLQVEVPTALSFTVDNQGRLTAASFTVTNKSQSGINLSVGSFQESKRGADAGITLHNDITSFNSLDRSNVVLVLRHGSTDVILQHDMPETKLATIAGNTSENIQVLGTAGKDTSNKSSAVETTGVDETFDLVFKITKNTP